MSSQINDDRHRQLVSDLREKHPTVEIDYYLMPGKACVVLYSAAFFDDDIRISKSYLRLRPGDDLPDLEGRHLTEAAAREAIASHLVAATEKFQSCLEAVRSVQKCGNFRLEIDVADNDDSDDDLCIRQAVSFHLGGFYFSFNADNA